MSSANVEKHRPTDGNSFTRVSYERKAQSSLKVSYARRVHQSTITAELKEKLFFSFIRLGVREILRQAELPGLLESASRFFMDFICARGRLSLIVVRGNGARVATTTITAQKAIETGTDTPNQQYSLFV